MIAITLGCVRSRIPDMLTRTWKELDYCLNMCRITNGGKYRKYNENKKTLESILTQNSITMKVNSFIYCSLRNSRN